MPNECLAVMFVPNDCVEKRIFMYHDIESLFVEDRLEDVKAYAFRKAAVPIVGGSSREACCCEKQHPTKRLVLQEKHQESRKGCSSTPGGSITGAHFLHSSGGTEMENVRSWKGAPKIKQGAHFLIIE